ncbi:MAG: lipid A biosynthesis acyltransferase, partial [Legionellales bacterium]|nr:lipid A biosynthesis acyltransferase [Legionellales bacterium]
QLKKLGQSFYTHLLQSIVENIKLRFMSLRQVKQAAEIKGHEQAIQLYESQKSGLLILTGHFGNWEFAPLAGILNFDQYQGKFFFIRRLLKIKWLEKLLFRRYYKFGLGVIPSRGSMNQVCDELDAGNSIIFVMDQHAVVENKDGIRVDFFGKPAGTYRSLATIARYTGAPVVPAACYRKADGKHVLHFLDPIPWQEAQTAQAEIYQNTLAYNQALENIILAHPEQWMWLHNRWKL